MTYAFIFETTCQDFYRSMSKGHRENSSTCFVAAYSNNSADTEFRSAKTATIQPHATLEAALP